MNNQHNTGAKEVILRFGRGKGAPNIQVIIPNKVYHRLSETVFRGKEVERAGNAFRWNHLLSFLHAEETKETLWEDITELAEANMWGEHGSTVTFEDFVAWTIAIPRYWYEGSRITRKSFPDGRAYADFITEYSFQAEPTPDMTIVYRISPSYKRGCIGSITIQDVYPGEDLGEFFGNMTEEEDVYFFDWNHPVVTDW